jgi:TPR repeat protein
VAADPSTAVEWYARDGSPEAAARIAAIYENELDNPVAAQEWHGRACSGGQHQSCQQLASYSTTAQTHRRTEL